MADIRLIMLTSLDGSGELELARQVGIATYLVKPVRQSRLLNALASAMGMEEREHDRNDASPNRLFSGSSVLLVEDHPVNQKVGKAMLEQLGCSVEVAGQRENRPRRALPAGPTTSFSMDCQMPEMDGYEATRTIRKSRKRRR